VPADRRPSGVFRGIPIPSRQMLLYRRSDISNPALHGPPRVSFAGQPLPATGAMCPWFAFVCLHPPIVAQGVYTVDISVYIHLYIYYNTVSVLTINDPVFVVTRHLLMFPLLTVFPYTSLLALQPCVGLGLLHRLWRFRNSRFSGAGLLAPRPTPT
jgi:hypothetical protein